MKLSWEGIPMNPRDHRFTELIQEHHASLRYFIHSLGVNPAWVDDVAQDAFLLSGPREHHRLRQPLPI